MTAVSPSYVLDASIAAKWYLPDEDFGTEARAVFTEFIRGSMNLVAPQHIDYEIANVLWTAVRRGRTSDALARTSLIEFLSLPIEKAGDVGLVLLGYDLARQYGCAAYDGLYLALADEIECQLLHADRRLHNILNGRSEQELWVEDFQPPQTT